MSDQIDDSIHDGTLNALLDELVPASGDGRLPAAGALGIGAQIRARAGADADLASALARGLGLVAEEAAARSAASFGAVPEADRRAVLERVAERDPEFFEALLTQTAIHYYSHPTVVAAIGMRPGPPFPQGYEVAPFDEGLLAPVRERSRIYREV